MSLKTASREVRLQWFARQVLDQAFQGDVDGGDLQSYGVQAGLLTEEVATEADIEKYSLEETEPGDTYFKFSPDIDAENVDWKQLEAAPTHSETE